MKLPGNTMFLGMAVLLVLMGGLMLIPVIAVKRHQKKCRKKVYGKCISLSPPNWPEDIPNPPYQPTYEVLYKGEAIQITRTVGKNDARVEVGKEYELYIDPDNPENFINPDDNEEHWDRIKYVVGCFVGAVIMIGVYVITIFLTT